MIKSDIFGAIISVICLAVGLTIAMTVTQDAWKANEHAKAVWWGFGVWIIVGIGLLATVLPMAHKADGEHRQPPTPIAAQRPWITIKSVRLEDNTIIVGKRPTILVELQNTGQTPALEVRPIGIIGLTDSSWNPPVPWFPLEYVRSIQADRPPAPTQVMGAGAPFVFPLTTKDGLSKTDVDGLVSGVGRFLIVYGLIEYKGVGDNSYMTTFAYRTAEGYNALGPWRNWNDAK